MNLAGHIMRVRDESGLFYVIYYKYVLTLQAGMTIINIPYLGHLGPGIA